MTPPIAPEPRNAAPRIPAGVWVLGFVSMLMDVSSELIHALLPLFMTTALGASAFTVGLVEGLGEATALMVRVLSGAGSDWMGRRKPVALAGYALGAASKPVFALAGSIGWVLCARVVDRIGKGIRSAPRDALVADMTPPAIRGAAYGLRQTLDTLGAIAGPLLAVALMLLWANDFRAVFWVAVVPGALSVLLFAAGVREPQGDRPARRVQPWQRRSIARLGPRFWAVVAIGSVFTLARFSEAFLVLRAQQTGLPLAWVPMVLVAMSLAYSASAYPFGVLSDRVRHSRLLAAGLVVLVAADVVLASTTHWAGLLAGVVLWGLHMGMTQGLLAAMVADVAPAELRGTAFGLFNLACGVAMLAASAAAGLLWDLYGAKATFIAGAVFSLVALAGLWRYGGLLGPPQPAAADPLG